MMRKEGQVSTLHSDVKFYEEYFAAKNLTSTGINPVDWVDSQTWIKRTYKIFPRRKPSVTTQSDFKESIFFELESPFDELEKRLNNDDKVSEIVLHLRSLLNISYAKRLADRIQFLFNASKEEYPGEVAILPESLRCFVGFLQSAANLKYPDVVLSPSKNICAQWRTGPNKHFAVEFLPTGDAHFVIFTPDPIHPEKTIRMSGIVSVDSLIQTTQPHGVLSWCSQ